MEFDGFALVDVEVREPHRESKQHQQQQKFELLSDFLHRESQHHRQRQRNVDLSCCLRAFNTTLPMSQHHICISSGIRFGRSPVWRTRSEAPDVTVSYLHQQQTHFKTRLVMSQRQTVQKRQNRLLVRSNVRLVTMSFLGEIAVEAPLHPASEGEHPLLKEKTSNVSYLQRPQNITVSSSVWRALKT